VDGLRDVTCSTALGLEVRVREMLGLGFKGLSVVSGKQHFGVAPMLGGMDLGGMWVCTRQCNPQEDSYRLLSCYCTLYNHISIWSSDSQLDVRWTWCYSTTGTGRYDGT
jgi:hypothetical protein